MFMIRRGVNPTPPSVITQSSGLMVYYPLDDANTTTTVASDMNPNGFGPTNATLTGSPDSETGQILQGRRIQNPIKYGVSASAFQAPQTALSVSVWLKPTGTPSASEAIAGQADFAGNSAWVFALQNDLTLKAYIIDNASNLIARTTTAAVSVGSWSHVVMTWDGGSTSTAIKIYLNGSQVDNASAPSGSFTAIGSGAIEMGVGCRTGPTGFLEDVYLDDFRLYNRALSGSDILAIYNAGLAGNP